jgi:hypothetical protein
MGLEHTHTHTLSTALETITLIITPPQTAVLSDSVKSFRAAITTDNTMTKINQDKQRSTKHYTENKI